MNSSTVMLITIPIRPSPAGFPPVGSLSIINYLRRHANIETQFYDIDASRPDYNEAIEHIIEAKPDVLGISAVVSTSYAYTKRLSEDIRKHLPDTLIVVGGSMAASAELLLRRTPVDLCVIGEGEKIFLNIVNRAATTNHPPDFANIPGIVLLDESGVLVNTGYESQLSNAEVYNIDWNDMVGMSDIDVCFSHPLADGNIPEWMSGDSRAHDEVRRNKTHGTIVASKGCVAKCTFCHRWDKGIRYIPVDILVARVTEMVERFDLGFLTLGDENFGTDRRWLAEFCEKIKPFDLLWRVGGMRVNCVSPENLEMMRDAGCVALNYGIETGSPKMLQIMEKKTKLDDNRNAFRWTVEAGLWTGIQLVIGMPGEDRSTIMETIEFTKYAMTLNPNLRSNDLSINYAQALPGTPLYEYARHKGLVDPGIDGEEEYLLSISDRDAHDEYTTLNFTDTSSLEHQVWRPLITVATNYAYVKKFGIDYYYRNLSGDYRFTDAPQTDTGYSANPKRLLDTAAAVSRPPGLWGLLLRRRFGLAIIYYPELAYRMRRLLFVLVLLKAAVDKGIGGAFGLIGDALKKHFSRSPLGKLEVKSLRKTVNIDLAGGLDDTPAMDALRKGR